MSNHLSDRPTEQAERLPMIIRAMGVIERVGNALPHPFWLFWILVRAARGGQRHPGRDRHLGHLAQ